MRPANYDKTPCVQIAGDADALDCGYAAVATRLRGRLAQIEARRPVLVVDTYPGVDDEELLGGLTDRLQPSAIINTLTLKKTEQALMTVIGANLTEDRIFGKMSPHELTAFFDESALETARAQVASREDEGLLLVYGVGASLVGAGDVLVYADMARWEIQLRYRRGLGNWGADNADEDVFRKYKRGFFVEWRAADRHKFALFDRIDYLLDSNTAGSPRLLAGDPYRAGLREVASRPFRVVPFFDPAPWGGQWMKTHFELDPAAANYGWCFDCVPEENSLLLGYGVDRVEVPALNLVHQCPRALLGDAVYERFGCEFPIRFDLLDTIGGGHLSFQVHPFTAYIREHFGMPYTQDESYYMLDATEDACVYLGLRDDTDASAMATALTAARDAPEAPFDADRYVSKWAAHRHDHFLIPAGTVHCSGYGSMVLEISATPYIFTFKMWDWGRLGLDGRPRPINIDHGLQNIAWDRDATWTGEHLINAVEPVDSGDGWREERTGLHPLEFIETRRHWFTKRVAHDTRGTLNVLNLVAGDEAVVESPEGAFLPFVVHYAETFIVPAAVGPYTIRPHGRGTEGYATLKAYVRS